MTEEGFEGFLADAIDGQAGAEEMPTPLIRTYEEAGVLTMNRGLLVQLGETEFQITIVRRR